MEAKEMHDSLLMDGAKLSDDVEREETGEDARK